MPIPEVIIDEFLTLSASEKVSYYNDLQFAITVLKDHLTDPQYISGSGLKLNQERIVNLFIKKGFIHNNWLLSEEQISGVLDIYPAELRHDLDYLVRQGWLTEAAKVQHNVQHYMLTKEVKNGSKRSDVGSSLQSRKSGPQIGMGY